MEMGSACGLLSRLMHIWVMYGMVMYDTQHVFPGGGVGESFLLCQQEVFAMCHFGPRPADHF